MQAQNKEAGGNETFYRQLVEQVADAVIYADTEGVIRVWNTAAEKLFGFSASEALGQNLDLIIPERLRDAHWRGYDAALTLGSTKLHGRATLTKALTRDGGTIFVDMSFSVLNDDGKTLGSMAIARDATTRRAELATLRERIAELEKAPR